MHGSEARVGIRQVHVDALSELSLNGRHVSLRSCDAQVVRFVMRWHVPRAHVPTTKPRTQPPVVMQKFQVSWWSLIKQACRHTPLFVVNTERLGGGRYCIQLDLHELLPEPRGPAAPLSV